MADKKLQKKEGAGKAAKIGAAASVARPVTINQPKAALVRSVLSR